MFEHPRDTLITSARIIDPATGYDEVGDLLIKAGKILDFGRNLGQPEGPTIIDASGMVLCPGLVDLRASLGEPGFEYRETI